MRLPLLPQRPARISGSRCVVCQGSITETAPVRLRGMHFHRGCATYKTRTQRSKR